MRLRIAIFLLYTLLLQHTIKAQVVTTQGKEFYISFYQNYGFTINSDIILYLTSAVNTSGNIVNPNTAYNQPFTIAAGTVTQIVLPHSEAENAIAGAVTNKGLIVTAVDTISVYALSSRTYSSDATNVLQKNALGTDYSVATYSTDGSQPTCFLIEATQDNTIIKITPSALTSSGNPAGVPFNITLNKGQTYYVTSLDYELAGSLVSVINGCKPIAVFSGAEGDVVPFAGGDGDIHYEQLFPINNFGKQFITPTLKGRNVYRVRVYAVYDNTTIKVNGNLVSTINAGKYYEFQSNNQPEFITVSNPSQVMEFSASQYYDNQYGPHNDGSSTMITIPPLEQQIKESIFLSPAVGVISAHKISIICRTSDVTNTILDGVNVAGSFAAVPANPLYSYAAVNVNSGSHKVTNNKGFIAYCYGFGDTQGYGYCTGASVENINTYFACNQTSSIGNPTINICPGTAVFDIITSEPNNTSYTWDFGDGSPVLITNSNVLQQSHSYPTNGIYIVKLTTTSTSINACAASTTSVTQLTLNVQSSLTPSLSLVSTPVNPVCIGSTVNVVATPNNAGLNPSYQWKLNGVNVGTNSPVFTSTNFANNDLVSCIVTSSLSCASVATASASVTIKLSTTYSPNIKISASANNICLGDAVTFNATSLGTQPAPQYLWKVNGVNSGTNNTAFTYNPSNGDVVSCILSTSNYGCGATNIANSNSITIIVSSSVTPGINISVSENPICAGKNVTITAVPVNGGTAPNYQWKLNGNSIGTNSATFTSSLFTNNDLINCTMTSSSSCATTPIVTSNNIVIQQQSINLGKDTTICEGDTKLLDVTNLNSTYLWQDNTTGSTFMVTKAGKYFVTLNKQGCVLKDTIDIAYNTKPIFSLNPTETRICTGAEIILDPKISGVSYLWQDGSTASVYKVTQPGLYTLTATNKCGPSTASINIDKGVCNLYVPNSFTPNNDGKNDVFKSSYGNNVTEFHMQIFNRYGQLVFESSDRNKGWDGIYKGTRQPRGAYVWMIQYRTVTDNNIQQLRGSVLLLH